MKHILIKENATINLFIEKKSLQQIEIKRELSDEDFIKFLLVR